MSDKDKANFNGEVADLFKDSGTIGQGKVQRLANAEVADADSTIPRVEDKITKRLDVVTNDIQEEGKVHRVVGLNPNGRLFDTVEDSKNQLDLENISPNYSGRTLENINTDQNIARKTKVFIEKKFQKDLKEEISQLFKVIVNVPPSELVDIVIAVESAFRKSVIKYLFIGGAVGVAVGFTIGFLIAYFV